MKRRVQAQRKFAQGAPIPPNNANNSERKVEVVSHREEQRNVVRNNTGAKALLDIISFKQIHIHKTPVVVLERLRTDTINPYSINQREERVDELPEPMNITNNNQDLNTNTHIRDVHNNWNTNLLDRVAGDNSNTNICDSTTITSSKNTMLLRSRTRSNKKSEEVDMVEFNDSQDSNMTPNDSEQNTESEVSFNKRQQETYFAYENQKDNQYLIRNKNSDIYPFGEISPVTSTQRSYSCNMSDISLEDDKPLAQYARKKAHKRSQYTICSKKSIMSFEENPLDTGSGSSDEAHTSSQHTTCPRKSIMSCEEDTLDTGSGSSDEAHTSSQHTTCSRKSIMSCEDDTFNTGSGSSDEDYASLTAINVESTNTCDSSAEDMAIKKRKYTNNDAENMYDDDDCESVVQTLVQPEPDTLATLTRLPSPKVCNVTETIEILDDDDDVVILPSSESTQIKERRTSECPMQKMKSFCEVIDAPQEDIKHRCTICNDCVKLDKLIQIRHLVDFSKQTRATGVLRLNSLKNIKFLDTTSWRDQVTVDLDISNLYNLRVCYCKHVKERRAKPVLICTLIKKPITKAPPNKAIEAQYARIILEYLDKHFFLYAKEKELIQFETENERVFITRNKKIAFIDKTTEVEENIYNVHNTDTDDTEVIESIESPVDNNLNKSSESEPTKTGKKQYNALYSETINVDTTDRNLNNGNLHQSGISKANHKVQVTIDQDNELLREQIKQQFISGLKSLNPCLSIPTAVEYVDTVTTPNYTIPETQENDPQRSLQYSPSSSRVSVNQDIKSLNNEYESPTQLASQTDVQNEDSLHQQLVSMNESSERGTNENMPAFSIHGPQRPMSPTDTFNSEYLDINTYMNKSRTGWEAAQFSGFSCSGDFAGTSIAADQTNVTNQMDNNFPISRDNVTPTTSTDDGDTQNTFEIPTSYVPNEPRYACRLFNLTKKIMPENINELQPNADQSFINAPVFKPTTEEFRDPVAFFDSIMPIASKYGICKVIPPKEFTPSCTLNDDMMFNVTNQYVTRLFSRWGPGSREMSTIKAYLASQSVVFKRAPLYEGMEVNLPKLYQIVQRHGGLKKVIERKRWSRVAEEIRFTKGPNPEKKLDQFYVKYLLPYDTLSSNERGQIMSRVERAWCEKYRKMTERAFQPLDRQNKLLVGSDSSEEERSDGSEDDPFITGALVEAEECVIQGRKMNLTTFKKVASNALEAFFPNMVKPSTSTVEEEYWRLVLLGSEHLCVISASIDTGTAGYGFTTNSCDLYGSHPWNLKNMASNKNNILRYLGPVLGVTLPTLHLGMVFSTSCWHRDPHGLPWTEYMHSGPTKIWYGIPDEQSERFRKAVESLCPTSCQNKTIWLPSDIAMIPPNLLREQNVTLSRVEQNPGEYIIIFPKAYSCSISTGYTVSESVYFASKSWLLSGLQFFTEAQISCEPTMISIESLMLSIVMDQQTPLALLQPALSVLIPLLEYERTKRYTLEDDLHMYSAVIKHLNHSPGVWNVREQDECEFCRKSLFLSRVCGLTTNNSSVCLEHAIAIIDVRVRKTLPMTPFEVHYFIPTEELTSILKAGGTRLCKIT